MQPRSNVEVVEDVIGVVKIRKWLSMDRVINGDGGDDQKQAKKDELLARGGGEAGKTGMTLLRRTQINRSHSSSLDSMVIARAAPLILQSS